MVMLVILKGELQRSRGTVLDCWFPWMRGKHPNNLPLLLAHSITAITLDFGSGYQGSIPCGPITRFVKPRCRRVEQR